MVNQQSKTILSIANVSKSFPGVKALDNITIDVVRGTVHGIVGENGAGKSTLMKILSGVFQKDTGTVIFNGEQIENTTPAQSLDRGLSIIYQEFNLVSSMSVGENIFLGRFREMKGMRGSHKKAREILDKIGSKVDTRKQVAELSAAEKQMVEIAKALSFDSSLIIMDEPSSSLTEKELNNLANIIRNLSDNGITIIYISHKLEEIFEFCDNVTVMRDGCVIDTRPVNKFTKSEMIEKMIGRSITNEFPDRPHCVQNTLLEVKNINTSKLHDISFELKRGEILGLVGLVGAGRTEIVRAIFGADKVRHHSLYINGERKNIRNPIDAKKNGIGLVPEDRKVQGLVMEFSVSENITMACIDNLSSFGFLDKSQELTIAEKHVEALSIKTPSIKTKIATLSGGNQQKCIVSRWMELNPQILIMDEPTRGIDVGAKYDIYQLMKSIVEKGGSIILISSELNEVLNMSNRVLTIKEGHIVGEFNPESTSTSTIMHNVLGVYEEVKGS